MDIFIEKISLHEDDILYVKPKGYFFEMLYRSTMGVHWDEPQKCLYHDPPKSWNTLQWYRQIIAAVENEYGITLKVCPETVFENIDEKIKIAIVDE